MKSFTSEHELCLQWPYHGTCKAGYISGSIVAKRLKTPITHEHAEAEYHCMPRYTAHVEMQALAAVLAADFTGRQARLFACKGSEKQQKIQAPVCQS